MNASSPEILLSISYGSAYEINGDKVTGFATYTISDNDDTDTVTAGNKVFNQKGIEVGTIGAVDASGIYPVQANNQTIFYLKETNDVYFAYASAEQTQPADRLQYRTKIGDLKDEGAAQSLIEGVRMDNIIITDGSNAIMNYFIYGTTNPVGDSTSRTLGEFMRRGDKIVDDMLNELVLADILPENLQDNKFLKHIDFENTTLNELGNALDNLAVQDILTEDMYSWAYFYPNNYNFYKEKLDKTTDNADNYVRCKAIKIVDGDTEYFIAVEAHDEPVVVTIGTGENQVVKKYVTYYRLDDPNKTVLVGDYASPLSGVWKYLLTDKDTTLNVNNSNQSGNFEIYCNLTSLGSVSNNLTANMADTTLRQLSKDGIIGISGDVLNQKLTTDFSAALGSNYVFNAGGATYLGDLTINNAMDYITFLLNVVNRLTSFVPGF